MAQEQSLPEDYNTEFDPEAFLKKLHEQAAAEKSENPDGDKGENKDANSDES
ncbi:MAG: cell division protein [Corynebacterium casei]|uniref:cell division protein n=1 Tax=Corynebacterium casei TaxID=160386 RepID=UPI003F95E769